MDSSMGSRQAFAVKEVLEKGLELTKKNWVNFLFVAIVIGLVTGLIQGVAMSFKSGFLQFLFFILLLAWDGVAVIAMVRFFLSAVDGKRASMKELFSAGWMEVAYMVGTMILVSLVVGIGTMLFVVPGIIACLMFMYAPFALVEKKLSPIAAMKASMALTEGHRNNMFMYGLSVIGVAFVIVIALTILAVISGALAKASAVLGLIFGIAFLAVSVVTYFAFIMTVYFGWAYIYRKLTAMRPEALKA